MFKLRPYQSDLANAIREAFTKVDALVAVLPTGGGKTPLFSELCATHDGSWAAVVHRKEILSQISLSLARFGLEHRIAAPSDVVAMVRRKHHKELGRSFVNPRSPCIVASAQTLSSKSSANNAELQRTISAVSLAVFDEGHHYVEKGSWSKAPKAFQKAGAKLLFITATPERADGVGLGDGDGGFAQELVEGPSTRWLIENGYLTKFKYKAPDAGSFDVAGLATTKSGDFNAAALRARVVESELVGDAVQHYIDHGEGKQAILFAPDIQTALEIRNAAESRGVSAVALSGTTEAPEREAAIEKFAAGGTRLLINVDLFDEGFDVPAVEVVIHARPTESLGKYLQMCGRGLRLKDGKEYAIIIDMVRNWERHGMPDWPRTWTLSSRGESGGGTKSDTVPQRQCKECTSPYPAFLDMCPVCCAEYAPEDRSGPEGVDGVLVDLDVDALAALFADIEKAKQSKEDYERELIKKGVPQIGRPKLVRRHEAAKYRREVLHNLTGWWCGVLEGQGRSMKEVHRTFYFRFGVDIGTAFTLGVQETDALIERIKNNFDKDLNYDFNSYK